MEEKTKLIKHLAELGMLSFSDDEWEKMANDMQDMIELINEIKQADVTGVKSVIKKVAFQDLRKDEEKPSFDKEDILRNAHKEEDGTFVVAKVVD